MSTTPLHNLVGLPEGKAIGDVLPAFSGVHTEIHLGKPNTVCASCRKPFSAVRKRRQAIRLYSTGLQIPVCLQYWLCGCCVAQCQLGGNARDAVLASVEAFADGSEASA